MTGVSVILAEDGASIGADVRGCAPGTRETDLIKSEKSVEKAHAVVLAGGSAFGLDAAAGVMEYLSERDKGYDTGFAKVPIVPEAVIFDLSCGNPKAFPDKKMGYLACENASNKIKEGNYGAGCGATVGKLRGFGFAMKGGVGYYEIKHNSGLTVGAYVVVNACGEVYDEEMPFSNNILAGSLNDEHNKVIPSNEILLNGKYNESKGSNTTIACIITNAVLSKVECNRVASMAHNGLARSIRPVHTSMDGDTIFTMASGEGKIEYEGNISDLVGYLAQKALRKSVISAIVNAQHNNYYKTYNEL